MKQALPKGKHAVSLQAIEYFDIFPWISDFETGIVNIDEQHQTLVRLLNKLARELVNQSNAPLFDEIFRELGEYAIHHFEAEEKLMRQFICGDVLESDHQQTHRKFTREISRLKRHSKSAPASKRIEGIVAFLSQWLANHILKDDRRVAGVILAIQAGMPIEVAKAQVDHEMSGTVSKLIDAVLGVHEILSTRSFQLMAEIVERQQIVGQHASIQQIEWEHIQRVLQQNDGNISAAARTLNMDRRTLQRKLRKSNP